MVIFWIFNYAFTFISAAIVLLRQRKIFTLVLTENETTLLNVVMAVYGSWLVISIGSAVQTWRSSRPSIAIVFLVQIYISLTIELVFLTVFFMKRDLWIEDFLVRTLGMLVKQYLRSEEAKYLLDGVHETFECCGLTQWHYEFWMDENGAVLGHLNSSFAWVPQSCCIRTAYYNNCGLARPRMKVSEIKDSDDDMSELDKDDVTERIGSFGAADWYTRINNEPCTDMVIDYIGEWPSYVLMALLALSVGKASISTAASMAVFSRKAS